MSQEQEPKDNSVQSLVDSILDGDAVNSKSQFEDLMNDRINDYLDASKKAITSNLFNDPSEVEDEETEEVYVEHMCAKHVLHPEYGEGVVLEGQHALPDQDGNISWYTVQFNHGTETIETEDVKIMHESHHGHMMKKKKKKMSEEEVTNEAMHDGKKKKKHDCASKVKSEQYGIGHCIPGQHTMLEDGTVTHYDVKFKKDGKLYIAKNVPIAEATDIVSEGHKHASKKTKSRKMKEGMGEDVFREIEGINDVYDELEQLNREKMGGGISDQLDIMRQHIESLYRLIGKDESQMEGISPVPMDGKCPSGYKLSPDGKRCIREKKMDEGKQIIEN